MCDKKQPLNRECPSELCPPIHGMIDGNAYHSSLNTWPLPLMCAVFDEECGLSRASMEASIKGRFDSDTKKVTNDTKKLGNRLINLNSGMYLKKTINKFETIPSLIIAPTMDMELAHIDGYGYDKQGVTKKIFIYSPNDADFCKWEQHIKDYVKYQYEKNKYIKNLKYGLFSREEKAIYTNIETDALLTNVDLFRGKYQVTIHELWHNIDYLAGLEIAKANVYFSHYYSGGVLVRKIIEDVDIWVKIHSAPRTPNRGSRQKFYDSFLKTYLKAINDRSKDEINAYSLIFDILDGARYIYNKDKKETEQIKWETHLGIRDEEGKYWEEEGILAAECFANFGCVMGSSPEALKIMSRYLSQTHNMCDIIISDLWKHFYQKNNINK